jgi:hypothetical protein
MPIMSVRFLKKLGRPVALPVIDLLDDIFPGGEFKFRGVQALLLLGLLPSFRRDQPVVSVCPRRLIEAYCLVFLTTRADRMYHLRTAAERREWKDAASVLGLSWRAAWFDVPLVPVLVKRSFGYGVNGEAIFQTLYDHCCNALFYRGFVVYARYRYLGFRRTGWSRFVGPYQHADCVVVGTGEFASIPIAKTGFTFSQVSCVALVTVSERGVTLHHYKFDERNNDLLFEEHWQELRGLGVRKVYAVLSGTSAHDTFYSKLKSLPHSPNVLFVEKDTGVMNCVAVTVDDQGDPEIRLEHAGAPRETLNLGVMRTMPIGPDGYAPEWLEYVVKD